jgi:hypothetical protein
MSVYVDRSFFTSAFKSGRWRYNTACHMMADTTEELHAMAKKIGLKRSWFQSHTRYPHYDLTQNKRSLAVKEGAIEMGCKELIRMFMKKKGINHA